MKRWLFAVLTLAIGTLVVINPRAGAQDGGEPRDFLMGFTPFPWAISFEAINDVYAKIATDADLIVHHFDNGVPWPEALAGTDFHPSVLVDWNWRRSNTPEDHQILLTVTPISFARDGLAAYRGENEDMPLPTPWDSYAFDHPDVIQAFTRYCEDIIAYFEPDYFMMGIEVNLLMKLRPDRWDAYMVLHRAVYAALKTAHPDLPVFVSLTGIDLLPGYTEADQAAQRQALADVETFTDLVAFSIYPYMTGYMTNAIPGAIYDELAELTDKPMAVSETGYPAQSFRIDVGGGVIAPLDGTPEKQAEWIALTLEKAQEYDFEFVVNFVSRDYDDLWRAIGAREDLTIAWRDTGLYAEDGAFRPSLAIWREWLARPLVDEDLNR
ncbi:MAG: hypothetical protein IPK19_12210 [Chloroflexi bacterium]|nr:hypothetical protein [Chloroflexota bacterium]